MANTYLSSTIEKHALTGIEYSETAERIIGDNRNTIISFSQGTLINTNLNADFSYVDIGGKRYYRVYITGTPYIIGDFYCILAVNAYGNTPTEWRVHVKVDNLVSPEIKMDSLDDCKFNEPYNVTLEATGTGPITWSIVDGSLPKGLTLDEGTGVISGTPIEQI